MKKAVALRYNHLKNKAPQVVAAGQGLLAAQILKVAKESQVPLYKHKDLAEALFAVPLGAEIPPELYELTAQVLAFVLSLDREEVQAAEKKGPSNDSKMLFED
ncbi:MAG: hypothetical protein GX335_02310 [Firmicutes bacterium]|nr:hypothetical protein [Bacillota bacterium]